jgi:hypothetical protein
MVEGRTNGALGEWKGIGCHVDASVEYSPQNEGNRIFED